MYLYHALVNALSAHIIRGNLNTISNTPVATKMLIIVGGWGWGVGFSGQLGVTLRSLGRPPGLSHEPLSHSS